MPAGSAPLRRGDVWRVALDPGIGNEQAKTRPCVIVQRDAANRTSSTCIIVPITDARDRSGDILNVAISAGEAGLRKQSRAVCNQVRTVDRRRFRGSRLGSVSQGTMSSIESGLRAILDLGE